jgi:hypothetical protein
LRTLSIGRLPGRRPSSSSPKFACLVGKGGGSFGFWKLPAGEHGCLKFWPVRADVGDERFRDGLDHPVDMDGLPTCVRPEADVDLFGVEKLRDYARRALQYRSKGRGFDVRQFGDMKDMALGFHDQRPDPKGTHAVLDAKMFVLEDASAGRFLPSFSQVASQTPDHKPTLTIHRAGCIAPKRSRRHERD